MVVDLHVLYNAWISYNAPLMSIYHIMPDLQCSVSISYIVLDLYILIFVSCRSSSLRPIMLDLQGTNYTRQGFASPGHIPRVCIGDGLVEYRTFLSLREYMRHPFPHRHVRHIGGMTR